MPAAALWWRLSRHLAPAALSAQAGDLDAGSPAAPPTLRPAWTGHLDALLGDDLAARVVADPAWPALVAAVSQATDSGWTPEQVLATAHGLLPSGASHDPASNDPAGPGPDTGTNPASPRPSELATALVRRVAMLSDGPQDAPAGLPHAGWAPAAGVGHNADPYAYQQAPVDPYEQELLPPEDLDDSYDDGQDHQVADLADLLPHVDASEVGEALPDQDEHWLASLTDQEPPHDRDADREQYLDRDLDLDLDDVDDHDQMPSWLPSAADAARTAGQAQLWPPPHIAGRAPDVATAAPTAAEAAAATPAALVCRERLLELNVQALAFYSSAYGGSWAQQHLQQRLGTDLISDPRFTPGYAPAGWTRLVDHLRARGATDPELLQAGLASQARTGRLIDRFRDRLILPIQTLDTTTTGQSRGAGTRPADAGQVGAAAPAVPVLRAIGFVGRRHPDAVDGPDGSPAGPKYLNTADNLVFSKGAQLYGLAEAAQALAAGAVPVLVEGALDALAVTLAAGGDAVGVAPLGTAFTNAQADTLQPYLPAAATYDAGDQPPPAVGVVVATDADTAGRKAANRAYWQLVARGGNPGHLALPDGLDPAELLTTAGPGGLREALTAARASDSTLARHLVNDRVASYADRLHTAEGTVHAIRSAAKIIAALPPGQWPAHIAHLDTLVDAAPGITGMEVLDAALARAANNKPDLVGTPTPTISPTSTSPARTGLTRTGPTRTGGHAPRQSSDEAPAPTAPSAHVGTAPATGPDAEPEATSSRPMITAAWAVGSWHDVGVAIDPRLVTDRYWPALAVALERAWRAGYDVQQHLPTLAGEQPLAADSPAYDLQYRLIRECPDAHAGVSAETQGNTDRRLAAEAAAVQNPASVDEPRLDPNRQAPRQPRPGG